MNEQDLPLQTAQGSGIAQAYGAAATATVNIGLTPEQVRDLALAVTRQESAAQAKVQELSSKLEVSTQAVTGFLRTMTASDVPIEKWPQTLAEIAQRHRALVKRLVGLATDDPAVKAILDEARAVIDRANSEAAYDRADRLLAEAEAADLSAVKEAEALAREAQAAALRRRLNAATTRAERGELSLTRLSYLEAAQHFKAAAMLIPIDELELRADFLYRYAGALARYGEERGENTVLLEAIAAYHNLLKELPKERVPQHWAATQNNLGNALRTLGERESGTARLEEAVAACRAALQERTRERVPLAWAMTTVNLGLALLILGELKNSVQHLTQAMNNFEFAQPVFKDVGMTSRYDALTNLLQGLARRINQLSA